MLLLPSVTAMQFTGQGQITTEHSYGLSSQTTYMATYNLPGYLHIYLLGKLVYI